MKKLKLFFALFTVLFAFILTNCSENEKPCELLGNCPPDVVELDEPNNPNNPYDFVGKQHNEGLYYIFKNYSDQIKVLQADDQIEELELFVIEKAIEFGQSKGYEINELPQLNLLRGDDGRFSSTDYFDFNRIVENSTFPEYDRMVLIDYLETVSSLSLNSIGDVNKVLKKFKEFENEVVENEKVTQPEKILSVLSVGKHSTKYWAETSDFALANKPKWKIILADVGGGILGGATTGPGGIIMGAVALSSMAEKW